jgi:urease accessory protein
MRQVNALAAKDAAPVATATLTFEQRRKSRQRLRLDDGTEAALLLPRGTVLAEGDRLQADDGAVIAVRAAPETLSVVRTADDLLLARVAYHLGNRHVPLQIARGELRYQHDHVLDGLAQALGLRVEVVTAPFVPEPGAYGHGEEPPAEEGRRPHGHGDGERGHAHAHDAGHHHDHELVHPHGNKPRR